MQIHNKGINSSNKEGVTKVRVSLDKKGMKKGYDIGQFQRSGEISFHFGIWPIWGVEIDYSEFEHGYR